MRNYLPALRLPSDQRKRSLQAKFGGIPWGLLPQRWPVCRECGLPMSCLAQIPVRGHLDRVGPLVGRDDLSNRVLHLFTCERPSVCSFWEPHDGANAAFFFDADALKDDRAGDLVPDAPVMPEAWIEGWIAHDDLVTDEIASDFLDCTRWYALPDEIPCPDCFDSRLRTKLGGVPYWTGNGPQRLPQPPFRFLMQIDLWLMVPEAEGGSIELGNFCSDGTGYLFVNPDDMNLPSLFLINR